MKHLTFVSLERQHRKHSWQSYLALGMFAMLPLLILPKLNRDLKKNRYLP